MADLPAAASFTKPRGPLRLGDYSWTLNAQQTAATRYLFRDPIIGNIPAPRRLRDYGWSCNLVTTTLIPPTQNPLNGWAYPATRGSLRAREYGWSVVNLLESTLAPSQVDPFHTPEFPSPRKSPRAREYGWSVNLLQTTLKPAPETLLFRVAVVTRPRTRKPFDYGWNGNNILLLGEPIYPVEWDAPERAKRLRDYSWAPEIGALLIPSPTVPTTPEPPSLGGSKRKKVRGPYNDPKIYDEYIKRCIDEREVPREDVAAAQLKEALVCEVEARHQTGYAERDALIKENQLLEQLIEIEKARRDIMALKARQGQIDRQLRNIEEEEVSMLLALFNEL